MLVAGIVLLVVGVVAVALARTVAVPVLSPLGIACAVLGVVLIILAIVLPLLTQGYGPDADHYHSAATAGVAASS